MPEYCQFCPHILHVGKCALCRCKAKQSKWQAFVQALGNAIGQAKFGD